MAPSLTDLRKAFYGAGPTESVSDAEWEFLQGASAAGLTGLKLLKGSNNNSPIKVVSTADLPTANNAAWTDLDPGGAAAARPLDIVFPDCQVGDWIKVQVGGLWSAEAIAAVLDAFTIVAGVPVNQFSDTVQGFAPWTGVASVQSVISGFASYQIQANDIEGGSVRVRIRYKKASATAKTLFGVTAGFRTYIEGAGPFP